MKRRFYNAPSGRLHRQATCSGGAGKRRMVPTMLTFSEWEEITDKCRCALTWPPAKQARTSSSSVSHEHIDGVHWRP